MKEKRNKENLTVRTVAFQVEPAFKIMLERYLIKTGNRKLQDYMKQIIKENIEANGYDIDQLLEEAQDELGGNTALKLIKIQEEIEKLTKQKEQLEAKYQEERKQTETEEMQNEETTPTLEETPTEEIQNEETTPAPEEIATEEIQNEEITPTPEEETAAEEIQNEEITPALEETPAEEENKPEKNKKGKKRNGKKQK